MSKGPRVGERVYFYANNYLTGMIGEVLAVSQTSLRVAHGNREFVVALSDIRKLAKLGRLS